MKNLIFSFLLLTGFVGQAAAQVVATVTHLSGILTARYPDGSSKLLSVKSDIDRGALLVTEKNAFARLKFNDASEIVLRPGSELRVDEFHYEENAPAADSLAVSMLKGGMRAVSGLIGKRNKDAVKYTTPTATIGIRGTHFGALFCNGDCSDIPTVEGTVPPDGLHVDVAQGAIQLTNGAASIPVNTGQFGFVAGSMSLPVLVSPERGVQVTMPASISQNKEGGVGGMAQKANETQCVAR
ncbi:MAG: hypothetical protein JWR21_3342 [Herminiimonas sp.]|nr:hypothetical protein [Herminiimonas sp.]MDB5852315.1 hypothetical protein [Herminiimonas sp.]